MTRAKRLGYYLIMMMTIRLSDAQISALECAGLEPGEHDTVVRAWASRARLAFDLADRDALFSELTDLSNAEDATAEQERDRDMRKFARRASMALATVASKVLRAA